MDSLKRLTVEETYELNDAIENKNFENIKEELGDQWLSPDLFRFGASSLWVILKDSWNITQRAYIPPLIGMLWGKNVC